MRDLVLIHAPAIYDFRDRDVHYGPISDVVPSYPIFDMYPIGFLSHASYLGARGWRCGILNLASLMLKRRRLDVSRLLRRTEARMYGIDVHWLASAQGATEVAALLKRLRPDAPVVVGGLSATYYHEEILEAHPAIDCVLLGDTTEDLLDQLLEVVVEGRGRLEDVPNLAWRDRGRVRVNRVRPAPTDLDPYGIDYGAAIRGAIGGLDPFAAMPYADFPTAPAGGVVLFKGCNLNCLGCGGARVTYETAFHRQALGTKSPETVWAEVASILEYLRIPIFFMGDPQLLGRAWLERFVATSRDAPADATIYFEFFLPPPRRYLETLFRTGAAGLSLQISPESHDESIRRAYGRPYGNAALASFLADAGRLGAEKVDVYFMTGLPGQDLASATETAAYAERLMARSPTVDAFLSPLAPFVDPGSPAFRDPDAFGYRLFARTFEEHRLLMDRARTWRDMLNYETRWMTREDLVRSTYAASRLLLEGKARHGLITEEDLRETSRKIAEAEARVRSGGGITKWEIVPFATLYPTLGLFRSLRPRIALGVLRALRDDVRLRASRARRVRAGAPGGALQAGPDRSRT